MLGDRGYWSQPSPTVIWVETRLMPAKARTSYFVHCPRDFANEYTVYAVPHGDLARFRALFPDPKPITRAKAIRLGWSRVREAKRDGEQWFGGFIAHPDGRSSSEERMRSQGILRDRTLEDELEDARAATVAIIDAAEAAAEAAEELANTHWA